jgi:outer membrane protein TolC
MKRLSTIAAAVLAVATSLPASAQPKALATDDMAGFEKDLDALFVTGGITADQVAARAATASPSVRRKVAEVDAAIASAEAAELQRVPQVGAKLVYTRLSPLDPISFGAGFPPIQFLTNSYVAEASAAVPLSDYVLRYPKLIEAARLAEDVAKISKRSSEVDAGEEARLAYYEWLRAKLQVLIAQRQLIQVQSTVTQFQALADAQRLSKADLLRVESQEAEAEQTVDQLHNLAELREEQLRLLIGASDSEPLGIGEDVRKDIAVPNGAKLDDLMGQAKQQRLDFRILDTGIKAKEKQRESESANRLPKLAAFGVVDYADPNPRVFPQSDKFTFSWSIGAQVTWTLNDTLIEKTTDRRLTAETDELRADRQNLERGARIEVLAAQQAVAIAQHALATSAKGLAAAEEGYRVRRELLAADRATAVELVDAETDLTRARITALNARVDLRVALTQLTHAVGRDH